MRVICHDTSGRLVSIDFFFSKFEEFSSNTKLANQTVRILKALTRDVTNAKFISVYHNDILAFRLFGKNRTYLVCYEIYDNAVILTALL